MNKKNKKVIIAVVSIFLVLLLFGLLFANNLLSLVGTIDEVTRTAPSIVSPGDEVDLKYDYIGLPPLIINIGETDNKFVYDSSGFWVGQGSIIDGDDNSFAYLNSPGSVQGTQEFFAGFRYDDSRYISSIRVVEELNNELFAVNEYSLQVKEGGQWKNVEDFLPLNSGVRNDTPKETRTVLINEYIEGFRVYASLGTAQASFRPNLSIYELEQVVDNIVVTENLSGDCEFLDGSKEKTEILSSSSPTKTMKIIVNGECTLNGGYKLSNIEEISFGQKVISVNGTSIEGDGDGDGDSDTNTTSSSSSSSSGGGSGDTTTTSTTGGDGDGDGDGDTEKTDKEICEESGGTWSSTTLSCNCASASLSFAYVDGKGCVESVEDGSFPVGAIIVVSLVGTAGIIGFLFRKDIMKLVKK